MERYTQQDTSHLCQMEHSTQCHPLVLENRPSMGAHKVGTQSDASSTLIEVRVKHRQLPSNCLSTLEMLPGCKRMFFYKCFFRIKQFLPHVQHERPVQLATFCTSAGVRILTCPAEEEEQRQHHVQIWQTTGLDD